MPVNVWHYTLKLGDIFHDDAMPFEQKRDEIVRRIKATTFWNPDNFELSDVMEGLEQADDVPEFDEAWADFYDYADRERIWVETSARSGRTDLRATTTEETP
jgi:hypothetical protein